MSETNGSIVTYGEHTIDLSTLPTVSLDSLIRKGLAHYLGNEQASKVTEWKKQAVAKAVQAAKGLDDAGMKALLADPAFYTEVSKGLGPNDAEVAAYKFDCIRNAVQALVDGKVGVGGSRPRGTALETVMRDIAEKEVRAVLKANNLTMPSGDKELEFADGTRHTRKGLIDRRLANPTHGPRIKAMAEKEIAARERMASKATADGASLADALGL